MNWRRLGSFIAGDTGRHPGVGNRWRILARFLWFGIALTVLFWWAKQRFALPLDPMTDGDSYGYLYPGLSKLTGGAFGHAVGREFLYPVFIFLALCLTGDFRTITIGQHILGIATAGLLLLAWQSLRSFRRAPREATVHDGRSFLAAAAWQFPGLFMANLYLAYVPTLLIEHTVRPESVFAFGAMLSIWMNLGFVRRCWLEGCPPATWKLGAAHLFLSGGLFLLRPSFAFGVAFVNLPLLLALWTQPGAWMAKWRPVALAVGGACLLLFLPESTLRRGDGLALTMYPSMRLFAHADLVAAQMDADLASGQPPPYDRAMLQTLRDRLTDTLAESRRPEHDPWIKLGFNPDYMYMRHVVLEPAFPNHHVTYPLLARFCNYYYLRVVLHRPLAMAKKVLIQLTFFYSFDAARAFAGTHLRSFHAFLQSIGQVNLKDANLYPLTVSLATHPPLQSLLAPSLAGQAYLKRCVRISHHMRKVPQPPVLRWIDDLLDAAYFPILILALAACAVVLAVRPLRAALGTAAWATLLLYSYNFGTCLTIATVFYLGEGRYIFMQKAFTLFSEFAGVAFLARCVGLLAVRRSGTAAEALQAGMVHGPAGAQ